MKVQPQELDISLCRHIGHSLQGDRTNESSEVKALVRSASNSPGCSIKRKLQRRNLPTLYSTWVKLMDVESVNLRRRLSSMGKEISKCTHRIHRRTDCDMVRESHYQSWEGLAGSHKALEDSGQGGKDTRITLMGSRGEPVRLSDEAIVPMKARTT